MPESMTEYLRKDMECEGLLECMHGLKELDKQSFRVLDESNEPLTIDEIAEKVDRERSTVYRSIQRLLQTGFIQKEQRNYEDGGYYHVYHISDPEVIGNDMQKTLNDWYAQMGQLIQEFKEKYGEKERVEG